MYVNQPTKRRNLFKKEYEYWWVWYKGERPSCGCKKGTAFKSPVTWKTGLRKNACNALKRLKSQSIDGCWALHVLKKKVEVGTLESDWELIKRILKQVNEKGWIKKESSHAMYILCTGKFRILQICQIGH